MCYFLYQKNVAVKSQICKVVILCVPTDNYTGTKNFPSYQMELSLLTERMFMIFLQMVAV